MSQQAPALVAWERFWFAPQPAHRIALFRIVAPLAILGLLSSRLLNWQEFFTTRGFHVPRLPAATVQQPLYLPQIGDGPALVITGLLILSGLCVSAGLFTRVANVVFALLLGYVSLFDRMAAVSVNKLGTTTMLALCFCPSGAAYSLDALLRRRRDPSGAAAPGPRPGDPNIPGTVIRFLQVQLAVMYCASGVCKSAHGDWLQTSYVLWSQIHGHYQTALAYFAGRLCPWWAWPPLQYAVLGYELGAPGLLAWRRTRTATVAFGMCMHLFVALLFSRLIFFSVLMMSLLTLFLPDEVQLRLLSLSSLRRTPAEAPAGAGSGWLQPGRCGAQHLA